MTTALFSRAQSVLKPFQEKVEALIRQDVLTLGSCSKLRDACEYALLNGGKRFRPALVMLISDAIGLGSDASYAALAMEYFHTSSLIADDLPCMDNDDLRRGKPTVHKVYGETVALLASYVLIAEGYGCLEKNALVLREQNLPFSLQSDRICSLAVRCASDNGGLKGVTGGQYFDLYPEKLDRESLLNILKQKTVSLFEMSFVFGWLYGGGKEERLSVVKETAYHFGLAFQIADDLQDMEQDKRNERLVNVANLFGQDAAEKMLQEHAGKYQECLRELNLDTPKLLALLGSL